MPFDPSLSSPDRSQTAAQNASADDGLLGLPVWLTGRRYQHARQACVMHSVRGKVGTVTLNDDFLPSLPIPILIKTLLINSLININKKLICKQSCQTSLEPLEHCLHIQVCPCAALTMGGVVVTAQVRHGRGLCWLSTGKAWEGVVFAEHR